MKKRTRTLLLAFVVLLLAGILAALNFYGTFYADNVARLEKQPRRKLELFEEVEKKKKQLYG